MRRYESWCGAVTIAPSVPVSPGTGRSRAARRRHVEGGHRLGAGDGGVEPETVAALRLEPGEVRVHRPPAFGARHVSDLRGEREAAGGAWCSHGVLLQP